MSALRGGILEGGPQVAARGGGLRAGPGKGRALGASGGDGSAEGRCEPLSGPPGEPWREAVARRPHQCPRPQQRPRPSPQGPPSRRLRAPRIRDAARRAGLSPESADARERGQCANPDDPASGTPGTRAPRGRSDSSRRRPSPAPPRRSRCRPAGCCGGNGSRRAAGAGPRTRRSAQPGERESSAGQPRRGPRGALQLQGRAPCVSRGQN